MVAYAMPAERVTLTKTATPRTVSLSPAQNRIWELLCLGRSDREIEAHLCLSRHTVAVHLDAVRLALMGHPDERRTPRAWLPLMLAVGRGEVVVTVRGPRTRERN